MGKFAAIKKRCLERRILYEDPDFPATSKSLFLDGPIDDVLWKRPSEISTSPHYIQTDAAYHDMDQGNLGNCWFIASVVCITASPQKKLLDRVVPRDQGFGSDYCGAFRFYFWQYGKWEEVIVDDRLPTVNNKLIYGSNRQQRNEFWCPLLEKAFAKLNGSYNAIDGGYMDECLVDLTGGIGDYLALGRSITTSELQEILVTGHQMNSVIGGVINSKSQKPGEREVLEESGLYSGHAYTVINVKEASTVNGKVTLLHVRNPWGRGDWKGAWSDGSKEWKSLSRQDRLTTFKYWNDGEFWMSVDDFRKHFTFVVMAHLTPDAYSAEIADNLQKAQWKLSQHHGSWVRGLTSGGPLSSFTSKKFWRNPQFKLKLSKATKPTTVIISLMEINKPPIRTLGDVSIGFIVFKMRDGKQPHRITADNYYEFIPRMVNTSGAFTPHRDVTGRFVMEPADHVIVPCTQKEGQQAEFYIRVFSEQPVSTEEIDGSDLTVNPATEDMEEDEDEEANPGDTLDQEFDKLSGSSDGIVASDMQTLLQKVINPGKTYQMETCRCLLSAAHVYSDTESGIATKEQVRKAFKNLKNLIKVFKLTDSNNTKSVEKNELRLLFKILEYDVSADVINAIMTRLGGRQGHLGLEDFIQICCKLMALESAYYKAVKDTNKQLSRDEVLVLSLI